MYINLEFYVMVTYSKHPKTINLWSSPGIIQYLETMLFKKKDSIALNEVIEVWRPFVS